MQGRIEQADRNRLSLHNAKQFGEIFALHRQEALKYSATVF